MMEARKSVNFLIVTFLQVITFTKSFRIDPYSFLKPPRTSKYHEKSLKSWCKKCNVKLFAVRDGNNNESVSKLNEKGNFLLNQNRKLMTVLASIGALETLYLTWNKLSASSSLSSSTSLLFCNVDSSSGCNSVLNGPYASISIPNFTDGTLYNQIPLAVFGFLAYTFVCLLSSSILLSKDEEKNIQYDLLLLSTTSMASFSLLLLFLLFFTLHEFCLYCYLSAFLSFSLFGLSLLQPQFLETTLEKEKQKESRWPKIASSFAATTLLAGSVLFSSIPTLTTSFDNSNVAQASESNKPPVITTKSTTQSIMLAKKLKSLNTNMYGAYWCSHCFDQKQTFGKDAFTTYINYIECDKEGYQTQRPLCKEKGVPGYPTFEINGELYPGEMSLEELEEIVNDILEK